MSLRPENATTETRAGAILDFCERCVRDELPDLVDEETDGPFMTACVQKFGKDLTYLTNQAAAQTKASFYRALRSADSLRVVPIHTASKEGKRLKTFHCDVCGTKEHNCGYAIDLAGLNHKPDVWFGDPQNVAGEWARFINEYTKRFKDNQVTAGGDDDDDVEFQPAEMLDCDQGRYYVGNTCLRKSKLVFLCSTLLQETMYKFHHGLNGMDDDKLESPEWLLVDDDRIKEFIDMKTELELCIANEKRAVPDVEIDDLFWEMVDHGRDIDAAKSNQELYEVVRSRTRKTLARFENEDGIVHDDRDDDDDGDDDGDDDQYEPGSLMPTDDEGYTESEDEDAPRRKQTRGTKRIVVLDEEEEEDDDDNEAPRAPKRQKANTRTNRSSRRSSRIAGTPAPEPPVFKAAQSNAMGKRPVVPRAPPPVSNAATTTSLSAGNSSVADAAQARREVFGSVPQPPSRPSRIATAMRIPSADGTPGPLGSRRAALLQLMDVQRELVRGEQDELAAKLSRAILTFQELLDLV